MFYCTARYNVEQSPRPLKTRRDIINVLLISSYLKQVFRPISLFQALGQLGRSKKRARDERDLVKTIKKIGEGVESPLLFFRRTPFVPRPLFQFSQLTESLQQVKTDRLTQKMVIIRVLKLREG